MNRRNFIIWLGIAGLSATIPKISTQGYPFKQDGPSEYIVISSGANCYNKWQYAEFAGSFNQLSYGENLILTEK